MDVDGTKEVHLKEEILMDILSRLPVLSLLRFKCVSKYWMTLISKPYFTLKHLNMQRITKIPSKFLFFMVSFPCIVLLYHWLLYRQFNWMRMYENLIGLLTRDHGGSECNVVTMAWLLSSYRINNCLAFVHAAFHWLDSSLEKTLISFSISNEVYGEIPLPEGMSLECINGVAALEGMLCVYSNHIRRGLHTFKLWILKDYDVEESWNRLFTIQGTDLYSIPKYKFSDGEVLLRCRDLKCGSVFKTLKESCVLWPLSVSERIQDGFVYTENLISPKLLA
ncbi:hypothetical protein P3S67_017343 [Capsicum chacoense]